MARSLNEIMQSCTIDYLDSLDPNNIPPPDRIEAELVAKVREECLLDNAVRGKDDKLRPPTKLCAKQIADIMLRLYPIVRVKSSGSGADAGYDLLAIYQPEGENAGIYVTDDDVFRRIANKYNYSITKKELDDILSFVMTEAPRVDRCMDRDLIAVNNGIFHYVTKQLMPFSSEMVFLAKSRVNYNPAAANVVIHNDDDGTNWDVESWMDDLSDDPEIVDLLWQILSAIIRPFVRWNKSAWLYSITGNNGKGTLCELMRSLVGRDSYASIPLCDFSKDFALEPLIRTQAIIVDENDVGTFIDKAANLKAVITNDVISVNRKFKTPIAYQFFGFMVQCLNEFPRFKDKSDSFYRRQLFVPFEKCFTGHERKYIKNDYLHRPEVLEYVLYRVLNMNFYELSEPASCRPVLEIFKQDNDPVLQFWTDTENSFVWDLVPGMFLYDLYKAWFKKNNPCGSVQGKSRFLGELKNIVAKSTDWDYSETAVRSNGRMNKPEPLIVEYDLTDWMSKTYVGTDPNRLAMPSLHVSYRGLLRCGGQADDDDDTQ